MRGKHAIFSFLCFILAFSAQAETVSIKGYLLPGTVQPEFLSPPLKKDSAEWKQDIEKILSAQRDANDQTRAAMRQEEHMSPELVTQVLGPEFTREKRPALYKLLDRVAEDSKSATMAAKAFWNTNRPYLEDKRVNLALEKIDNGAYPSGHACGSRIWAEVAGQVLPDKRAILRAKAESIAQNRLVAGIHYPDDLRGGRQLALLVFGALQMSPEYHHDLESAQKEAGLGSNAR